MTIAVVNPRSGNITSVKDMLERLGRSYKVLDEPELDGISQILLPGQGRFGAVMTYFNEHGWTDAIKEWVAADKPLVGICVGMQVLFESSDEDPGIAGLGIFSGNVFKLDAPKHPMIGWSRIHWNEGLSYPEGNAYFVNSYGIKEHPDAIATTTYGNTFSVAVGKGNIVAFQFHPEKSGYWGRELLNQCLTT